MWHIHYHLGGAVGMRSVSTLPAAMRDAFTLIGQGADVGHIEGEGGLIGPNAAEIKLAYAASKGKNGRH